MLEVLTAIKRAGADLILTYFAKTSPACCAHSAAAATASATR